MPPTTALLELTDRQLSSVTGGFLPLLGLLGMGANLAGSIMGGIGKSKSEQAQAITASSAASQAAGAGQPTGQDQAAAAPTANSDLIAPRASSACGCNG